MRMVLIRAFSLILSGKWPQAVRANGHLLLNSEKVWKYQSMQFYLFYLEFLIRPRKLSIKYVEALIDAFDVLFETD